MWPLLSNPIFLFVAFIVFLVVAKTIFRVVGGALLIAGLGAMFPVVLSKVFGYPIHVGWTASLMWAIIGVGAYLVWTVIKMMYQASQVADFLTQTFFPAIFFPFILIWKGLKWIVWKKEKKERKTNAKT